MIRAMFLEFPGDSAAAYTEASQYQYMWGENLLVAPVYEDVQADDTGNDVRNGIYLPGEDQIWIDYWSGQQYRGGQILNNYDAPVWKMPLFVKSGAIIPMYEENNNPGEVTKTNEKGLDKTKRIIEFWPDGETDFDLYEDDGRSIDVSDPEEVSYGGSVTTHITSSVDEDEQTATLTIEESEGDYEGYDSDRLTTFVVNVSQKPTAITAKNGTDTLQLEEAQSLDTFNADEDGNVYFYDAAPNMNKYSQGEGAFARTEITTTPKLYVKFARTDVDTNAQTLVVEGFSNSQTLDANTLNEDLPVPTLVEPTDDEKTPTSITVKWNAPENITETITGYDIEVDGVVNTILANAGGTVPTSYLHKDLDYNSAHTYRVRVRTASGYSNWSKPGTYTSLEDPWRNVPAATVTWSGGLYNNQGADRAIDHEFQAGGDGFHSDANAIGQELIYDMGMLYDLDKLEYYPRADQAGTPVTKYNGTVTQMDISVSRDGVHWQAVNEDNNQLTFDAETDPTRPVATIDLSQLDGTWRYVKMIPRASTGGFFSAREIAVYKVDGTSGRVIGDMLGTPAGVESNDMQTLNTYKGIDSAADTWGQVVDYNLNGVFDIYDYSFTLTPQNGGTTKTGNVGGNILMLTNKDTVAAGEEFTIDLYGVDLENVNAFGAVIDLGGKYDFVGVKGSAYVSGMTDYSANSSYLTISFGNVGDGVLVNGTHNLATITLRAKAAGSTLKLAEAMLIGPENDLLVCTNEAGDLPATPAPTTTTKYQQSDFNITMTNKYYLTDEQGTNVTQLIQQGSYNGLFNGNSASDDRSFEFMYTVSEGVTLPVTLHFGFSDGPKPLSTVNVYNSYATSNGFVTKYKAEVVFADDTSYETGVVTVPRTIDGAANDNAVMTIDIDANNDEGKLVQQVNFTPLQAYEWNNGTEDCLTMLTLTEAEFLYTQSNTVESISFDDNVPEEMYVDDIVEISAAVSPADAPYRYYNIESSDPDTVEVIRVADGDDFKFYLKAKKATEEGQPVTLTATAVAQDADGNDVTDTVEITVNAGVNTAELEALIRENNNLPQVVYTEDSYNAYRTALEDAVALLQTEDFTKRDVDNAIKTLSDAIDGLTFREIDDDTLINTSANSGVTVSSVKSEIDEGAGNGLSDKVLDHDESTYWHSNWSTSVEMPQWLIFDLGDVYELTDISFLPRVGSSNGDIFDVEVLVSSDLTALQAVTDDVEPGSSQYSVGVFDFDHSEKELLDREEWKQITFPATEGQYVMFRVISAGGGTNGAAQNDQYATMSEIRFYGTKPLPPVDTTKLEQAIDDYGGVTNDGYTDTTWAAYVNALTTAENIFAALQEKPAAYTQDQVNAAAQALETAYYNLAKPEEPNPSIPENPDPDKPGTGTGDGSGSGSGSGTGSGSGSGNGAVSTGDSTNIYAILMMLIISGGAVVILRRKKNS